MESLQLAQMLADLSSLNEAVSIYHQRSRRASLLLSGANISLAKEPPATSALLNATKTVDDAIEKVSSNKPQPQAAQHLRPAVPRTTSSASSPSGAFDRFGRHVLCSNPPSRPGSVAATAPGTPTQSRDVRAYPSPISPDRSRP